jgi:hypothetical protein
MTGQPAAVRLNSQLVVNRATQPLPAPEAPLVTNNPKNYRLNGAPACFLGDHVDRPRLLLESRELARLPSTGLKRLDRQQSVREDADVRNGHYRFK